MATSDSEPPSAAASAGIAGHSFSKSRRGYNPDEVDRFLQVLDDHVSQLQAELEWHRARSDHLARRESAAEEAAYARLSRQFADVVRAADQAGAQTRSEAEAEAATILARAKEEKERIIAEAVARANGEGDRIVTAAATQAEEEADEIIKTAEVRAKEEADRILSAAMARAREEAPSIGQAGASVRRDEDSVVIIESGAAGDLGDLDLEIPEFDLSIDVPEETPADQESLGA